ncbi:hypothetical protein [Pantanalinema sp. GBBB05]|uniref:hypothetical protein n=1 Tax=Pantanalinema sp. GBBB05 TaxID=2604139 RepID=UPI001D2BD520|nr:hypothetical protein [Pantanalinema sp. GBBB05]
MNTLDDLVLIQKFIRGETTLLANQRLRVESVFDSIQLLAKRGGLIATIKQSSEGLAVLLRRDSDYYGLVHQCLLDRSFMPTGVIDASGFEQYCLCRVPAGYKLNCTEARALWKEWWMSARHGNRSSIQTNLLIFTRNTWYPIREIACNQGTVFISTLVTEVMLQGTDQVIWLSRLPGEALDAARSFSQNPAAAPTVQYTYDKLGRPTVVRSTAPDRPEAVGSHHPAALPKQVDDSEAGISTAALRPDLRQVVKMRHGKLYITTAVGEIVVQGGNLQFWLQESCPNLIG